MPAPVKNTCPDIDKVIRYIDDAMKIAHNGREEFPEAKNYFRDIYNALDGVEDMLDDLRKDNAALREWGDDLEKELGELEGQQQ